MPADVGTIVSVTGPLEPDELGFTLSHEQTFVDVTGEWFEEPESAYEQ